MTEHTSEPWRYRKGACANEGRTFVESLNNSPFKKFVAETTHSLVADPSGALQCSDAAEANARRIVACVNACAGIPTEMLERNIFHRSPVTLTIAAAMADMEKEAVDGPAVRPIPDDEEYVACDECGAFAYGKDVEHEESCSLHPANIVGQP